MQLCNVWRIDIFETHECGGQNQSQPGVLSTDGRAMPQPYMAAKLPHVLTDSSHTPVQTHARLATRAFAGSKPRRHLQRSQDCRVSVKHCFASRMLQATSKLGRSGDQGSAACQAH